ncbi:YcaO-like family protein [Actinomadura sp. ATCC 31491]|uniref:YcaO-like family protein n=1 Tax=Actinomadura luzonensis TaxID=2805427 RepID=A0ABT0G724_9ACTN|nr:YcaO-like family protein [Actinomadura luzonensis]MCK2220390.1 YcaO-like family protein [Actinomadura luzonensis]
MLTEKFPDTSKVRLPGTDRACDPAATLAMTRRAARQVGVTRVADITRLDTVGIPTFQAIRPASRTLAVSQGKGVTPELARLSAVMESIELWHAEQDLPPAVTAPPREVAARLGYDVRALVPAEPSLLHDGLPLDWLEATSLADGSPTLVPRDVVALTLGGGTGWSPPLFFASSNGLAGGNTRTEATLHALYEVIERDAVTAAVTGRPTGGVRVDPGTSGSPVVAGLCAALARARVRLEVRHLPSPTGLPCFLARITCDDYPPAFFGFGCHLSSEIALTRAITESAQARLAYVSGARDDLRADFHDGVPRPSRPGPPPELAGPVPVLRAHGTLAEDLEDAVRRAAAAFGHPPLVVDLTREDVGVPVVKVVAPGARVCPEVM